MPSGPPIVLPTIDSLLAVRAVPESASVASSAATPESSKREKKQWISSLTILNPVAAQKKAEFEFRALQRRSEHEEKRRLSRNAVQTRATSSDALGLKFNRSHSNQQSKKLGSDDAMCRVTRMQLPPKQRHSSETLTRSHTSEEDQRRLQPTSIELVAAHCNDIESKESSFVRQNRVSWTQDAIDRTQRRKWKRGYLRGLVPDMVNYTSDLRDVLQIVPSLAETYYNDSEYSPSVNIWIPCSEPGCSIEASLWSTEEQTAYCSVHWGQKAFHLECGIKLNPALVQENSNQSPFHKDGSDEQYNEIPADPGQKGSSEEIENSEQQLRSQGATQPDQIHTNVQISPPTSASARGQRFFGSVAPFDSMSRAARRSRRPSEVGYLYSAGVAPFAIYANTFAPTHL